MNRDGLLPLCRIYGPYYGVPWYLLAGLVFVESRFNPQAVSEVGAQGLAQLMPGTWSDARRVIGLDADPFNPDDAVQAAAWYLSWLRRTLSSDQREGWHWILAAYNWGYGNVRRVSTWEDVPQPVRGYVRDVLNAAELVKLWEGEE